MFKKIILIALTSMVSIVCAAAPSFNSKTSSSIAQGALVGVEANAQPDQGQTQVKPIEQDAAAQTDDQKKSQIRPIEEGSTLPAIPSDPQQIHEIQGQ